MNADLTFLQAINLALRDEMRRDEAIYVLGEDVALGGPYGATRGLAEEFGEQRVVNTPISEATVIGLAIGAALHGLRPVVEIMFMDFITLAMDQLVNHGAKLHYMSGGQLKVPLTVRTVAGVQGNFGAHHSQSLEAWLVHVPGLKVVMPSTASDASGLLKSAIRDDNPVVFIEHRGLYPVKGEVRQADDPIPLGRARVRREGSDVTVIATARMVQTALDAAAELAADGIQMEVIDPRTVAPLDVETIVASVKKTHRCLIAHEAVTTGGVGAEMTARIQQEAFDFLEAPIKRVGAPFAPVPVSDALEKAFVPDRTVIGGAVKALLHND